MYYLAAIAAGLVVSGYTDECDDASNKCFLFNMPDGKDEPPSKPGKTYTCPGGPVAAAYVTARNQTIVNCTFHGDIIIASPGVTLTNVNTTGRVVLTGNAQQTTLDTINASRGVVARPAVGAKDSYVDLARTSITGVAPGYALPYSEFPIALAHPRGAFTVGCTAGTRLLIQPGRPGTFTVKGSSCPRVDLGALYGVFGAAIENIVLEVPPDDDEAAFNTLLNTLITVLGSVTAVQVFLLG